MVDHSDNQGPDGPGRTNGEASIAHTEVPLGVVVALEDHALLRAVSETLEHIGQPVVCAGSHKRTLTAAEAHDPDLLVVGDFADGSAVDLVTRLRVRGFTCRVILVWDEDPAPFRWMLRRLHVVDVVDANVQPRYLAELIEITLDDIDRDRVHETEVVVPGAPPDNPSDIVPGPITGSFSIRYPPALFHDDVAGDDALEEE